MRGPLGDLSEQVALKPQCATAPPNADRSERSIKRGNVEHAMAPALAEATGENRFRVRVGVSVRVSVSVSKNDVVGIVLTSSTGPNAGYCAIFLRPPAMSVAADRALAELFQTSISHMIFSAGCALSTDA